MHPKIMRIVFFYLSLMIFFYCQTIFAQDNSQKGSFNLYLLPHNIKANQLSKLKIDKLKPAGKPFLSSRHIERYVKDTHEIQLNYLGAAQLKKLKVPVSGKPFVVFAGGEAVYAGAFWQRFSSISFKGVAIDVANLEGDYPTIKLELDYPPLSPKNIASDPRPDARVMRALEQDGVLYEQVWFHAKCVKVRGTGKRHQSYVFTFAVTSVVKSKYDRAEISFELYSDFGGEKMREMLKAEYVSGSRTEQEWDFDAQKEILLKFVRKVTTQENPQIYLDDFEVN
jgi:hypothetical protein